jgi:hypothetical protein
VDGWNRLCIRALGEMTVPARKKTEQEDAPEPKTEAPVTEQGIFDRERYLRDMKGGGKYLDVKWRVLWLRQEHPDAEIESELLKLEAAQAVFKVTIRLPSGAVATGHGSETQDDFRDFLEKAETKALGRACAHLGYGTEALDADDGTTPANVRSFEEKKKQQRPQVATSPQELPTLSDDPHVKRIVIPKEGTNGAWWWAIKVPCEEHKVWWLSGDGKTFSHPIKDSKERCTFAWTEAEKIA